ncbi:MULTISPECIES: hypothetical protein [spotted fever group]|uniref:Uncharacterized protein n=1 Tax=Rickettsia tamurae subsp. buchneri TaxID=1462938 RepID=A0A8E1BZU7_9RICK|nr:MULTISPECIES: hypothetical protein [spotted fever group]EER22291.1 hypothetical protein REIS_1507 [Rickettsia endosymbiont of Ixodes scapularis]KDO02767.1 hypothetical protein REISMN_05370 [Rickettsia tamurae subsp. buchneri]KDO03396.1 hypothetical protein REISMN_01810 [Rickettsia tamurae subsp. buchneri]
MDQDIITTDTTEYKEFLEQLKKIIAASGYKSVKPFNKRSGKFTELSKLGNCRNTAPTIKKNKLPDI